MNRVLFALLVWNAVVFALYGYDKFAAIRGMRRISEGTLLACTFLFGSIGAITAMRVFRHKHRKAAFSLLVTLSLFTSAALFVVFFVR